MAGSNWAGSPEEETVSAFVDTPDSAGCVMTSTEHDRVRKAGAEFAKHAHGIWLLISGRFTTPTPGIDATHEQVRNLLRAAFDKPDRGERTLKVIVDSTGGNLDSAYATVLYLTAYAKTLEVYVPDSAKSASTLLAVGADKLFMSAFGELGPLDSQIRDPRNPVVWVSALDLYQSVDYVRDFGAKTVREVLDKLVVATGKRIPVKELVGTASTFSLGVIGPMMKGVTTLDFGGWGRSLMISERYASKLLEARIETRELAADGKDRCKAAKIAHQLVYGYPHHLFPIDINEANRIGLTAQRMDEDLYERAIKVVEACGKKDFVGFISKVEAEATRKVVARTGGASYPLHGGNGHHADLMHTGSFGKQS